MPLGNHKVVASGLRFPEGPVACPDGTVLFTEIEGEAIRRALPDGTVETVATIEGGPNGLAFGPGGLLYICNNGGFLYEKVAGINRTRPGVPEGYAGGFIQSLDLETGERRVLYTGCGEHRLVGPNDIVFDSHGGFYFTDFGKFFPRHRMNGGLYYALADGSQITQVAYPMISPNGVGLSPDGMTVYVAETETGRLWAFDLEEPGRPKRHPFPSPHGGRLVCGLPGYQRFDSLAVDVEGNICVATLASSCITIVSPEGRVLRQFETGDPYTTNICFGGPDRKTAYITLSGIGQIVAVDWPEAGLPLSYG